MAPLIEDGDILSLGLTPNDTKELQVDLWKYLLNVDGMSKAQVFRLPKNKINGIAEDFVYDENTAKKYWKVTPSRVWGHPIDAETIVSRVTRLLEKLIEREGTPLVKPKWVDIVDGVKKSTRKNKTPSKRRSKKMDARPNIATEIVAIDDDDDDKVDDGSIPFLDPKAKAAAKSQQSPPRTPGKSSRLPQTSEKEVQKEGPSKSLPTSETIATSTSSTTSKEGPVSSHDVKKSLFGRTLDSIGILQQQKLPFTGVITPSKKLSDSATPGSKRSYEQMEDDDLYSSSTTKPVKKPAHEVDSMTNKTCPSTPTPPPMPLSTSPSKIVRLHYNVGSRVHPEPPPSTRPDQQQKQQQQPPAIHTTFKNITPTFPPERQELSPPVQTNPLHPSTSSPVVVPNISLAEREQASPPAPKNPPYPSTSSPIVFSNPSFAEREQPSSPPAPTNPLHPSTSSSPIVFPNITLPLHGRRYSVATLATLPWTLVSYVHLCREASFRSSQCASDDRARQLYLTTYAILRDIVEDLDSRVCAAAELEQGRLGVIVRSHCFYDRCGVVS